MRSHELRSSSSTLSGAPSLCLSNSRPSFTNSKLTITECPPSPPKSPTREEIIAGFLEKAKFYTSVCLGEVFNLNE